MWHQACSNLGNYMPVPGESYFWTNCAQLSCLICFIYLSAPWLSQAKKDPWYCQHAHLSNSSYRTLEDTYAQQRDEQVTLANRGGKESLCRKHEPEKTGVSVIYGCTTHYSKCSDLKYKNSHFLTSHAFVCQEFKQGSAGQFICSVWH